MNGADPRSRKDELFSLPRAVKSDLWVGDGVLKIAPTGAPWSIQLFRGRSWYINLEDVHRRDERNIYTRDRVLDVVVDEDRTARLKDADELELAVRAGRCTRAEADEFHADAREVMKLIACWGSPFRDGWETWTPDPSWPIPPLPVDVRPDLVS